MNTFLSLPEHERTAIFQDVGAKMNIPAGYVEKDFWVCWMLELLFSEQDLPLVFRGGTSLSKAYEIINRFSEDIDLSISREWLGITSANDPSQAENKSQADKFQKQLRELTREKLTSHVLPKLEKALADLPDLPA